MPSPFWPSSAEGQGRHSGGQQQKAGEIEAPGLHGVVGHQTEGGDRANDPHRDVDEEDPVPEAYSTSTPPSAGPSSGPTGPAG